jgi:5-methylthioadenosine/S-adenosylhomocysteine deaminase
LWLIDAEIDLLAATETTVALCPVGNMKTRSGAARIRRVFDAGVHLALGCDNYSCSDAQNMFVAMRMMCSIPGLSDPVPEPPLAADALHAACAGWVRARWPVCRPGRHSAWHAH